MMKNKILFIGFELGSNRKEAVSINFKNHITKILPRKDKYYVYSLSSRKTVLGHVFNLHMYLKDIVRLVKSKRITHIHDFFVLPTISLVLLLVIKFNFRKIIFVKELHNNFGFSKIVNTETILRIIFSSKLSIYLLIRLANKVYSRSKYISKYWKIMYIPQYISQYKLNRKRKSLRKEINICYLGHPLYKKGIDLFPKLISEASEKLKKIAKFNFAFSNIGDKKSIIKTISLAATKNAVNVSFSTNPNASFFFRKSDIYVLPLIDEHSATSVPNTILESMEAGCVVIASRNKITASVIKNNFNGILLNNLSVKNLTNAINNFIASNRMYYKLSSNSRKYIEVNYNIGYIRSCFKKIYEQR